jgi:hypothetical protein
MQRSKFGTACFGEVPKRISFGPIAHQRAHLFERKIGREVLFRDRCKGSFRFVKNGVGRANPDAIEQSVDRQ